MAIHHRGDVLVYIWTPHTTSSDEGKMGHAALSYTDEKEVYISFAPNVGWYNDHIDNYNEMATGQPLGRFIKSLQVECESNENEGRNPDHIFLFQHMDVGAMIKSLEAIKTLAKSYSLELGESYCNTFRQQYQCEEDRNDEGLRWRLCGKGLPWEGTRAPSHSCVSIVCTLLVAGGLEQYVSRAEKATTVATGIISGSRDASRASATSDVNGVGRASAAIATRAASLLDIESPLNLVDKLKVAKTNQLRKFPTDEFYVCPTTNVKEYRPSKIAFNIHAVGRFDDIEQRLFTKHSQIMNQLSSVSLGLYIPSRLVNMQNENVLCIETEISNSTVLSVLGHSGYGKTLLGLNLCAEFWRKRVRGESDRVPIYIYLPEYSRNKCSNLLSKIFNGEHRFAISKKYLLILDGYDELGPEPINVHGNQKGRWSWNNFNIKTVILCKPQYVMEHQLQYAEVTILPFDKTQISTHVREFAIALQTGEGGEANPVICKARQVLETNPEWSQPQEYLKWFTTFPELYALAETPMLLTLILTLLPIVIVDFRNSLAKFDVGERKVETAWKKLQLICSSKTALYDEFTRLWFEYQTGKIVDAKQMEDLCKLTKENLVRLMYMYAQNLAMSLVQQGVLSRVSVPADDTLRCVLGDESTSPELLRTCREIFPIEDKTNEDELRRMNNLKALRNSCLLQLDPITGDYRFNHFSLAIYFASKELFETVEMVYQNYVDNNPNLLICSSVLLDTPLNYRNHGGIIRELGERIRMNEAFASLLLRIVEQSRDLPGIVNLSSNSATILCAGGFNLSGQDWQDVQIPNSNLDFGLLGNVDLRGANLCGVSLAQAWLPGAQLQGANMDKVKFGEKAALDSQTPENYARSVSLYSISDQSFWLVPYVEGDIWRFDTTTVEPTLVLKDKDPRFRKLINCSLCLERTHLVTYVATLDGHREVKLWSLNPAKCIVTFDVTRFYNETPFDRFRRSTDEISRIFEERILLDNSVKIVQSGDYFGFLNWNKFIILKLVNNQFRLEKDLGIPEYSVQEMFQVNGVVHICIGYEQKLNFYKVCESTGIEKALGTNLAERISEIHFCHGRLVVGGHEGAVTVLQTTSPYATQFSLKGHDSLVTSFTSNSVYLASSCVQCIYIWKVSAVAPWTRVRTLYNTIDYMCTSLAFSPKSRWLALGSCLGSIVTIVPTEIDSSNTLASTPSFASFVFCVCGNSLGFLLASREARVDKIQCYCSTSGDERAEGIRQEIGKLLGMVCLGGDFVLTVSGGWDWVEDEELRVCLYSIPTLQEKSKIVLQVRGVGAYNTRDCVIFVERPEQGRIAYGSERGSILVWIFNVFASNLYIGDPIFKVETGSEKMSAINPFKLALHSRWLAACIGNKKLCVWDTFIIDKPRELVTKELNQLSFTMDGCRLVGCPDGPQLLLWSMECIKQSEATIVDLIGIKAPTIFVTFFDKFVVFASKNLYVCDSDCCPIDIPTWFVIERCVILLRADTILVILVVGQKPDELCCVRINKTKVCEWSWTMMWTKSPSKGLQLNGVDITRSFQIEKASQTLLKQRGANGNPAASGHYISFASLFSEVPGTPVAGTLPAPSLFEVDNQRILLSNEDWAIFAGRFGTNDYLSIDALKHVFFVAEGFRNNRRFLIKAELVKDTGFLTSTNARIRIFSWTDYAAEAKYLKCKRFKVNSGDGLKFLKTLHNEVQQDYRYSILSNSGSDTQTCVTWVRKMLKIIGAEQLDKWYNSVVVFATDIVPS